MNLIGLSVSSVVMLLAAIADGDGVTENHFVNPVYPQYALSNAITAACAVRLDVSEIGLATNVCVRCVTSVHQTSELDTARIQASFEDATRDAISEWRYAVQHRPHQGVETIMRFTFPTLEGEYFPVPHIEYLDPESCPGTPAA